MNAQDLVDKHHHLIRTTMQMYLHETRRQARTWEADLARARRNQDEADIEAYTILLAAEQERIREVSLILVNLDKAMNEDRMAPRTKD